MIPVDEVEIKAEDYDCGGWKKSEALSVAKPIQCGTVVIFVITTPSGEQSEG